MWVLKVSHWKGRHWCSSALLAMSSYGHSNNNKLTYGLEVQNGEEIGIGNNAIDHRWIAQYGREDHIISCSHVALMSDAMGPLFMYRSSYVFSMHWATCSRRLIGVAGVRILACKVFMLKGSNKLPVPTQTNGSTVSHCLSCIMNLGNNQRPNTNLRNVQSDCVGNDNLSEPRIKIQSLTIRPPELTT